MPQVNQVIVSLKPHVRHCIHEQFGEVGSPEVRDLVMEALAARGYDQGRMVAEYAKYVAKCYETGTSNQFATTATGRL